MMNDFEVLRARIFEQHAARLMDRIDMENAMVRPGPRLASGAHSHDSQGDIRGTTEAAVAMAMSGREELAWRLLAVTLDHQDRDRSSMTYGNFFWHSGWTMALDPNAVSFLTPCLCYLLKHRGAAMPAKLRGRLEEALSLALEGLNAHRATWEYTNIMVLNMASKLMIGDCLGDNRATMLAYWDWEEWRNHTARLGVITEYNSDAYTRVQVGGLAMMLACDANPDVLHEVRTAMRHLITATVLDYHTGIGITTGARSRNVPLYRGRAGIDTIMHMVAGAPEPVQGCSLWLGVPIGPDDVLPPARNLTYPRSTRIVTHGFTRSNYLAPGFALGGISGRAHWCSHTVPFLLAYRSVTERCTIPFEKSADYPADAHFSVQKEGTMLAAGTWLIAHGGEKNEATDWWWRGHFTKLNTGRPDNLVHDSKVKPGYKARLGNVDEIRLYDGDGALLEPRPGLLQINTLVVQAGVILAGMRFTGSGGVPELELTVEEDGELVLHMRADGHGLSVSDLETAVFLAFLLEVVPVEAEVDAVALARRLAGVKLEAEVCADGWNLHTDGCQAGELAVRIDAAPSRFYETDNVRLTANQWARSLQTKQP